MDLFGNKEHDERHAATERQLRALSEQVAQLTIELGEARADIRRLQDDAASAGELDVDIADAKAKLSAATSATEEAWSELYPQLMTSLAKVRASIDAAGTKDPEPTDE